MNNKNLLKLPNGSELPTTIEECYDLIRSLLTSISELFKRIEKLEKEKIYSYNTAAIH